MTFDQAEAERFLAMDDQDLYAILAGTGVDQPSLYSKEGLVTKGKRLFSTQINRFKAKICEAYNAHSKRVDTAFDAMLIVVNVLVTSGTLQKETIYPLAALAAKLGIDELCQGTTEREEPGHE
ncbi:MAG: hypothetical protein P4L84_19375 [Isosphaeraceae bacterium]|nr:hypothetical protein [Isosphaeraceae bacterium]